MKKSILTILLLGFILSLSSCSPIIYLIAGKKSFEDTEGKKDIETKYIADNKIYTLNRCFLFKVLSVSNSKDTLLNEYISLKVIPGNYFNQSKIKIKYYKTLTQLATLSP